MSATLKPPSSAFNKLPEIQRPASGGHNNKSYRDDG